VEQFILTEKFSIISKYSLKVDSVLIVLPNPKTPHYIWLFNGTNGYAIPKALNKQEHAEHKPEIQLAIYHF